MRVSPAFNPPAASTGATTSAPSGNISSCRTGPTKAFYFIANLHALTTVRDRRQLWQNTLDAAIDLLALGLDPQRATLFVQSDVPEVSQLCWLLLTGAPMGLLDAATPTRTRRPADSAADAGLFAYPVLMAADILIYDSDVVPVGEDQTQHIEVARDLAASFNHEFGETFVLPKAKVLDSFGPRAGHRRREDVQELRQHPGGLRGAQGAAEADHADRHRLAAHGAAQGARRAITSFSFTRCLPTGRSGRPWRPPIAAAASAMAK